MTSVLTFRNDGCLYVTSQGSHSVLRYQALTGAFVDAIVPAGAGGLGNPAGLAFDADGFLYVASGATAQVLRYGPVSLAAFTVRLSIPSASPVSVSYTTTSASATAGGDFTSASGTLTFAPGQTTQTVLVPTLNDALVEGEETFSLSLSNPVGATLTDGQATGTIIDDDATKFFVVDDGSPDRTYRYGVPGNALANSALASGDTAPRGAASNAAGTTVWVADANKNVYVYNASGALLGSWAAGGLPKNSTVEGLATNGIDIWIVANSTSRDKVFKYTGAASRLSGSQSAASSFGLNNADTNPKGIVTDGTSIWIVDDGTTDKVYKYTLAGALLGSWTIDAANTHPTGLTINPASVSDIWIVDNGTLKVYQYTAAAGRDSGSQSASATFALAAGNTNPQDIADPPAPDMLVTSASAPFTLELPSAIASVPSLASRNGLFAVLGCGSTLALAGASGEQNLIDHYVPLALSSSHPTGFDPMASDTPANKKSAASTMMDSLFTERAEDPLGGGNGVTCGSPSRSRTSSPVLKLPRRQARFCVASRRFRLPSLAVTDCA